MLHDTRSGDARAERDRIRQALLRLRPGLRHRLSEGASGALIVPVAPGRMIEVGRMRLLGVPRWVVIEPMEEGARMHEPASLEDCARIVVAALERRRRTGAARRR